MKKVFLLLVLFTAFIGVQAQYTQTLPLNYSDFFRAEAINADGEHLERGEYAEGAAQNSEESPILADQWSLTGKASIVPV